MSTSAQSLPSTCRALVCSGVGKPLTVENIPVPEAIPGSAVVRVIAGSVEPSLKHIMDGLIPGLTFPTPFVPGTRAIGRIAATGPDATSLQPGQLVILDCFIRGRDDSNVQFLWGTGVFGGDPAATKLMENVWRNGGSAEYCRIPLENCYALNEQVLLGDPAQGGLGYTIGDLLHLTRDMVSYGGLRGIGLKAGETIIIAPATGSYSGAAVEMASAMGARVIAVGRNADVLKKQAADNPRVSIYQLKGNVEEDLAGLKKFGTIDAYLDISPAQADNSTHVRSCMMAVKKYGRVSLMGIISKDIAIPYVHAVLNNLTIRGQYMYEREDVQGLIKLAETGVRKLGKSAGHSIVGNFSLDEWEKAIEVSSANPEAGKIVQFML